MGVPRAADDFCYVHAADLHLDTPFKGISETAPHVAAALREASLEAFDELVQLCLDRNAAFLLVAGDIYDGPERGLRAQLRFRDGLQRLSDAGIESFVVHGNHDPVEEGWSALRNWPALVRIFGSEQVEAVEVVRNGGVIATVQGISYGRRDVTENLARRFLPRAGAGLQVGLLHCNVSGAADGYAPYSPCSLDDLRSIGLDYWALGHIHSHMVLSGMPRGDEPWVVYPGNLQARSRKPSELGQKGAVVVEVRGGRIEAVEAVACDRVRFAAIELDIAGLDGISDVHAELGERAAGLRVAAQGRSLVLQARLLGRGDAHADLRREGIVEQLLATLRDGSLDLQPFVWWDRIEDATLPGLDLAELRRGDDFAADLLDLADELAVANRNGQLADLDVAELLGKAPKELIALALEIANDEMGGETFVERSVLVALDRLEIGL
ncbi:MAG: metallophosphoesterase family protein [Acidimicrobiales bacterium]